MSTSILRWSIHRCGTYGYAALDDHSFEVSPIGNPAWRFRWKWGVNDIRDHRHEDEDRRSIVASGECSTFAEAIEKCEKSYVEHVDGWFSTAHEGEVTKA